MNLFLVVEDPGEAETVLIATCRSKRVICKHLLTQAAFDL
jgi:hypothetical protein